MSQQKLQLSDAGAASSSRWRRFYLRSEQRHRVAAFFAEFVGTATFIFIACMGCVTTPLFTNSHFELSLNFGLAIMIAIQSFGSISGAHLNPAITLAAVIYGALSWYMGIAYLIAQVAGALVGYGILKAVLPLSAIIGVDEPAGVCVTVLSKDISELQGVFIELLCTCFLTMVACSVWDPRNERLKDSVPLRFGLTVSSLNLAAVRMSNLTCRSDWGKFHDLPSTGSLHRLQHESHSLSGPRRVEQFVAKPLDLLGRSFGGCSSHLGHLSLCLQGQQR